MYFVYSIISLNRRYIYVGISANLKERIKRHNSGYEKTTKPYKPFILLYFEVVEDRISARQREKFLKSRSGKRFLYNIVEKHKPLLSRAGLSSWH